MRTIDLRTTQNVTITYELASAGDRIVAFIIDMMAKGLASFVLVWLFELLDDHLPDGLMKMLLYLVYVPLLMFPLLVMEATMNGQTIGKRAMRIRVIRLDGRQPVFYDYLLRWCFRLVDVYATLGISGSVMIASTQYAQRMGDMVSHTTVVRVRNRLHISLKDVLRIDTLGSYEPLYPAVRNFREEDMLLLKTVIERYQKFRNPAHREALEEAARRVASQLGVECGDPLPFLRTVLRDYVVLTR